jgi:hypothetical protein
MKAQNMAAIPLSESTHEAIFLAVAVADTVSKYSIDMAQKTIGHFDSVRGDVLVLANAHMQAAMTAYVVRELVAALRELTPEIAGAISDAGTDTRSNLIEVFRLAASESSKRGA